MAKINNAIEYVVTSSVVTEIYIYIYEYGILQKANFNLDIIVLSKL